MNRTGGVSDRLVVTVCDVSRVASLEYCGLQRYSGIVMTVKAFGGRNEAATAHADSQA